MTATGRTPRFLSCASTSRAVGGIDHVAVLAQIPREQPDAREHLDGLSADDPTQAFIQPITLLRGGKLSEFFTSHGYPPVVPDRAFQVSHPVSKDPALYAVARLNTVNDEPVKL